jgi:hypothetical protein
MGQYSLSFAVLLYFYSAVKPESHPSKLLLFQVPEKKTHMSSRNPIFTGALYV